jgi:transcriptional regulator with XRE-family HTH domain
LQEVFLENLNIIIANNLKNLRDERKLSLDKVSELTGVSKSMLGQIERGESNPTISTVWKIANGLKVSFTSLINTTQADIIQISKNDVQPLIEDNGKFRTFPIFPYEDGRHFEMYYVEIDKGGYISSEAHSEGTQEFITVFDSELTVRVNNEEYTLKKGDSIRFKSDKTHIYHNSGKDMVRMSMVMYYSA